VSTGVELGLISWERAGYFDTLDRPKPSAGRWWLVEKNADTRRPCWEFVPQLAAYVELIRDLGYHRHPVLFDTPRRRSSLISVCSMTTIRFGSSVRPRRSRRT
jgi:hypothetical protein